MDGHADCFSHNYCGWVGSVLERGVKKQEQWHLLAFTRLKEHVVTDDIGKLILRLTLGVLVLLHGINKLIHGTGPIIGLVEAAGFPGALAYLVYVGEVLAPLLLILGLWARIGAALIGINMVVAILLVHTGDLMQLTQNGGWALELQGMYLFTALALTLMGPGPLTAIRE